MPQSYRYAVIGTGYPHGSEHATGFGMAHAHMMGFGKLENVELVAVADLNRSAAEFFLDKYEKSAVIYSDYRQMLATEKPDIVSICTWPDLHAEMAIAAADAGVKVIHCEKPMATSWIDCKRMKEAADRNDSRLSFGHQRRYINLFQHVRTLIQEGKIGKLVQIEAECPNMFDWGTHWLDMMHFYNGEAAAEWVMGQLDCRKERKIFGVPMETSGLINVKWANGVRGVMVCGDDGHIGCTHRIVGEEGVIEVLSERKYRMMTMSGKGNEEKEIPQPVNDTVLSIQDVVSQLDKPGYRCLLSVDNAIKSTEIIFAAYYSSLNRCKVDLPLTYDGNALFEVLNLKKNANNNIETTMDESCAI